MLDATRRWEPTVGKMRPRIDRPKPKVLFLVIYTDAATKTRIILALILNREESESNSRADYAIASPTGVIFGIELLAIISLIPPPIYLGVKM